MIKVSIDADGLDLSVMARRVANGDANIEIALVAPDQAGHLPRKQGEGELPSIGKSDGDNNGED